jgi:hypothetical protein
MLSRQAIGPSVQRTRAPEKPRSNELKERLPMLGIASPRTLGLPATQVFLLG